MLDDLTRGIQADPERARAHLRAAARLESRIHKARQAFTPFVELCVTDPSGRPFRLEPMHLYWHRHVAWCWKRDRFAGIMSHWGAGKSAGLVVPLPAWLIGKDPNLRIKVICSSTELARERVEAIKNLVTSPTYRAVFPHVRQGGAWTASQFTVERTGQMADVTLQAKGVFGKGVGKRADVLIFDDVVDQLNSAEPGQRRKVFEFLHSTWLSRLVPGGKVMMIGTPWHVDDATVNMRDKGRNWCFLVQRVDDDCQTIHNEVHGLTPEEFTAYPRC